MNLELVLFRYASCLPVDANSFGSIRFFQSQIANGLTSMLANRFLYSDWCGGVDSNTWSTGVFASFLRPTRGWFTLQKVGNDNPFFAKPFRKPTSLLFWCILTPVFFVISNNRHRTIRARRRSINSIDASFGLCVQFWI